MIRPIYGIPTVACLALAAMACQPDATGMQPDESESGAAATGAAKPMAPISIDYEVIGTAVAGQPVQLNIVVTSPEGPVDVQYSLIDGSAVVFPAEQVDRVQIADSSAGSLQQLTVIPQREGRVFVNVSAEVQTADGPMIRSMSIPIRVGKAPDVATPNGEVVKGPDGEAVNVLPAKEN